MFARYLKDESGATAIEYGLIAARRRRLHRRPEAWAARVGHVHRQQGTLYAKSRCSTLDECALPRAKRLSSPVRSWHRQ